MDSVQRFMKKATRANSKKQRAGSSGSLQSQRDGVMDKKLMEGADRELYQYEQPKQELGMSDLIKNHESGTRFMYAAITGKESETIESKLRRLISHQPILRKKAIPIDNLPVIELFREVETFPLNQIIPMNNNKKISYGNYIRISDALVQYGAVVSPDCNFTKIEVGISDNRLLTNNMVKSFEATSNVVSKGNLSLPYCIPVRDADQLVLTISRERSFIDEGRQWGAIQIQLILEFTEFPVQYDNQPVAAINMVPSTMLETPINNPNNIDISIMNQDRVKLADLYLEGEVADENEPIANKTTAVKYAKSSISGMQKGKKLSAVAPEWSFLNEKRVQINQDQNSIEPSESDVSSVQRPITPPLKSAMKQSSDSSKKPTFSDIKQIAPF